jgi:hypothetical protein
VSIPLLITFLIRILVLTILSLMCRTCTSSMYTVTYDQLMNEFNCSKEVATLGLSFFIWGLGLLCPSFKSFSVFYMAISDDLFSRNWPAFSKPALRGRQHDSLGVTYATF